MKTDHETVRLIDREKNARPALSRSHALTLFLFLILSVLSSNAAQQLINTGSAANDGTGEGLRTAFGKCNSNFTYLASRGLFGNTSNSLQLCTNATAAGQNSLAIGSGAYASNNNEIVVGRLANTIGSLAGGGSIVLGTSAQGQGVDTIAVGENSLARQNYSLALGATARATGYPSISIGVSSTSSGTNSIAIGVGASDGGENSSVAIGVGATANANNQIRLGTSAETVSVAGTLTIDGTTNQVTFGGTNSAPVNAGAPVCWISVRISGLTNAYRLPLYQ